MKKKKETIAINILIRWKSICFCDHSARALSRTLLEDSSHTVLFKKKIEYLFFFLILHRETFHDFKSLFVEFTFYNVEVISSTNEHRIKKKKLDSTNTRSASHLPILSMIMCIKYLRNQNITYIYNKYVIREEFSFSSISFALPLHPVHKKDKKGEKKKKKKKNYEQKWSCRALYSLICREMYSPLRCCSGYLDYTLHAVLLLKLWYRAIRENIAVYWG